MNSISKKVFVCIIAAIFITAMCFLLLIFPSEVYAAPTTIIIDQVQYTYDPAVSPKTAAVTDCLLAAVTVVIPETIDIGGTDYTVTSIANYAFHNNTNLISITIANSVTTIGDYAFFGCTILASITIPDSLTTIGDFAFYNCSSLASAYLLGTPTIGSAAFSSTGTTTAGGLISFFF